MILGWLGIPQYGWALIGVAGFLVLLFVVALLEKRVTVPYVALEPGTNPLMGPYVQVMSQDISAEGFEHGGPIAHAKYAVRGTVWRSPDRATLVVTGSGTVMGNPVAQTWLFTPLADGRFLVTTDQNDEGDPSGIFVYRRLINTRFEKLWSAHQQRLAKHSPSIRSYGQATPFEALLDVYTCRVNRMIERRWARFIDAEGRQWRHTPRGALSICLGFFKQLGGALTQFWRVKGAKIAPPLPPGGFTDEVVRVGDTTRPVSEARRWAETRHRGPGLMLMDNEARRGLGNAV